jgi:ATPase subunit of ABC transporter with duplicated ATPase domains
VQWPEKKIKLDEEAISEILVADTNSESCSEASDFEDYLKEEEEEEDQQQQQSKPQQKSKHRVQQVVDYQPGDHL